MEIRDPIYGLVRYSDLEEKVMNHWVVQRLRNIHQLAMAYYVYPSALHTPLRALARRNACGGPYGGGLRLGP